MGPGSRHPEQRTLQEKLDKELEEMQDEIKKIVKEKLTDKIAYIIMDELYQGLKGELK